MAELSEAERDDRETWSEAHLLRKVLRELEKMNEKLDGVLILKVPKSVEVIIK